MKNSQDSLRLSGFDNLSDASLISAFASLGCPFQQNAERELMNDALAPVPTTAVSTMTTSAKFNPIWQRAEDSFLTLFCKITRYPWGSIYYWEKGQDWPKFNFLRISDSKLTVSTFEGICQEFQPWFSEKKRTFSIKIASDVNVSSEIMDRLKFMDSALVSLRYMPTVIEPKNEKLSLHRCQSVEELKMWWDINSDGRTRQNQEESPLWPVIVDAFDKGTQYYYLNLDGAPVSGGAFTPFGHSLNLWGLATRKTHQQKGLMADLVRLMMRVVKCPIYLQVLQDSITHHYFKRAFNAEELVTEKRYEIR